MRRRPTGWLIYKGKENGFVVTTYRQFYRSLKEFRAITKHLRA